jgi:hypothetical protein
MQACAPHAPCCSSACSSSSSNSSGGGGRRAHAAPLHPRGRCAKAGAPHAAQPARRPRGGHCAAAPGEAETPSAADQVRLIQAARAYAAQKAALEDGEDEDEEELVAVTALGLGGKDEMSDTQRGYAAKLAEALAAKAEALANKQRETSEAFRLGQFYYERGRYPEAVGQLQAAREEAGEQTLLGGEASASHTRMRCVSHR